MRVFSSARKASNLTRRVLKSQQNHHDAGLGFRFLEAESRSIRVPFYIHQSLPFGPKMQQFSTPARRNYATTSATIQDAPYSYARYNDEDDRTTKQMNIEIISREMIKPSSPTPNHLRAFKLSIIDQFFNDFHTHLVLFFPNTHKSSIDEVNQRTKHLKNSLSQLLTLYYPLAGELKDDFHIECNDKGAEWFDARVNQTLEEFLRQPDDKKVRELIAENPSTDRPLSRKNVTSVQVNVFECGGIALSTSLSHKIVDGFSYFTFISAWAAAVRSPSDVIPPSFVASELFPSSPLLAYPFPSKLKTEKAHTTKRFVLGSRALSELKTQRVAGGDASRGPTRMEATAALIWKAASKAASTVRQLGPQSPHALLTTVNLRKRASPPLPDESIGNIFAPAIAICFPDSRPDLPTLMGGMREAIGKISADQIEGMKGENSLPAFNEVLKNANELFDVIDEGDCLIVTSLLNSGIYDVDFGWAKPVWFYYGNPGFPRIVALNETRNGKSVEAVVSLSPEEMEIFERDPEILSYVSVEPSPLQNQ